MTDLSATSTVQRYQAAIAQLKEAINQSKSPDLLLPCVLEVLSARDALHTLMQETRSVNGETLATISQLDKDLKNQAEIVEQSLKNVDWQSSFNPPEKAWWWSLKPEKPNPWWNQDWIWKTISITCLTLAIGFLGDVTSRFLKGGPGSVDVASIATQTTGALLTAGGALTIAGQEAKKRLFKGIPETYWHELEAAASGLLLVAAVGFWLSLPQVASKYSDQGFENYQKGNWNQAEELYKRALQLNPEDTQTSFRLGLLYEELGDSEQARSYYNRAARAGIPEAINNLSRLKLLDKKIDDNVLANFLVKALEQKEKLSVETHYSLLKNLGWTRFQQGDYSLAASYLKKAIELQEKSKLAEKALDPKNTVALPIASPYCLLAQVKEAQGNKKAALADWDTCNALVDSSIAEENAWAITARKRLKQQDTKK